jgi:hypothetical protein
MQGRDSLAGGLALPRPRPQPGVWRVQLERDYNPSWCWWVPMIHLIRAWRAGGGKGRSSWGIGSTSCCAPGPSWGVRPAGA